MSNIVILGNWNGWIRCRLPASCRGHHTRHVRQEHLLWRPDGIVPVQQRLPVRHRTAHFLYQRPSYSGPVRRKRWSAVRDMQINLNNYWHGYWPLHPVQVHLHGLPEDVIVKVITTSWKIASHPIGRWRTMRIGCCRASVKHSPSFFPCSTRGSTI